MHLTYKKSLMQAVIQSVCEFIFIKAGAATCMTVIFAIAGKDVIYYEIVGLLIVIDILSGIVAGFADTKAKFSSKRLGAGIFKKFIGYPVAIVSIHQLVRLAESMFYLEQAVVLWIAVTEIISIFENLDRLGLKLPMNIIRSLEDILESKFNPTKKQ